MLSFIFDAICILCGLKTGPFIVGLVILTPLNLVMDKIYPNRDQYRQVVVLQNGQKYTLRSRKNLPILIFEFLASTAPLCILLLILVINGVHYVGSFFFGVFLVWSFCCLREIWKTIVSPDVVD